MARRAPRRGGRFKALLFAVAGVAVIIFLANWSGHAGHLKDLWAVVSDGVADGVDDFRDGDTGLEVPEVTGDYYTVTGTAQRDYQPKTGTVAYCPVDQAGRAVCAYGELTPAVRQAAKDRGRQDISIDPPGFVGNAETTIPALAGVDGSKAYSGWFWNRSHLLADSLGGDPTAENLVTGTRTQNVGSTTLAGEDAGGMAYTERMARAYLESDAADGCPLYYAATAQYRGSDLVPRTVTVDIQSCDKSIDERVVVSNTAAGHTIDYATGEWREDD